MSNRYYIIIENSICKSKNSISLDYSIFRSGIYLFFLLLLNITTLQSQYLNIPDSNFKKEILRQCDLNKDNEIDSLEALKCDSINIQGYISNPIYSITGIQSFANLKKIVIKATYIDSFDLSGLNKIDTVILQYNYRLEKVSLIDLASLTYLALSSNELNSIRLKNTPNLKILDAHQNKLNELVIGDTHTLEYLDLQNNELTSFSLFSFSSLKSFNISNNLIETLDLSQNNKLEELYIYDNYLDSLDLRFCNELRDLDVKQNNLKLLLFPDSSKLKNLTCRTNRLEFIDLSRIPNIEYLDISLNYFKNLDFSKIKNLRGLICNSNNFQNIDLSNNNKLFGLMCGNNPDLELVRLDNLNNVQMTEDYLGREEYKKISLWSNPRLSCLQVDDSLSLAKFNKKGFFTFFDNEYVRIDPHTLIDTACSPLKIEIVNVPKKVFCSGDSLSVKFSYSGNVISGNNFLLLLSDSSGTFSNSLIIGDTKGKITDSIYGTIPASISYSNRYKIRIISTTSSAIVDYQDSITISPKPSPFVYGKDTVEVNEKGVIYSTKYSLNSKYRWSIIQGDAIIASYQDHVCVLNFNLSKVITLRVTEETNGICSGFKDFLIHSLFPSNIIEQFGQKVTISPNPTGESDQFLVRFTKTPDQDVLIELIDIFGSIHYSNIIQSGIESCSIPVQGLSSGMYMLRVRMNNEVFIEKLIVN